MNSLEFINLEIAKVKRDYKKHINFGQTNFAITDEKRLNYLQEIKTELEFRVKKPFIKNFKTISYGCYKQIYLCPHCKEEISQSQKYCHECGQAIIINQSEENENE